MRSTTTDRRRSLAAGVVAALVTGSLASALAGAQTDPPTAPPTVATARLRDADGADAGTATFTAGAGGLTVEVEASGLTPGLHGTHVHARGLCAPGPDAETGEIIPFGAAGGHFDPAMTMDHGRPEDPAEVSHAGDLPNLEVGGDGTGRLTFTTDDLALDGERSIVGRSIVVHSGEDDHVTDPAGASGTRVLCGVVVAQPTAITERYALPGGATFPEGIAVDAAGGGFLVGSASQGTIYRVDEATGEVSVLALGGSPGRTAALGLAVDDQGRLLVAGGPTGAVAVLDADDGAPVATLQTPMTAPAFVNDLDVGPDGWVYVTDSRRPTLFRFRTTAEGVTDIEPWLDLTTTPIAYGDGINLNGVVVSESGSFLVAVQSNTGQLWRITTATGDVEEVDTGGVTFPGGDGLLLVDPDQGATDGGPDLYVVQNAAATITRLALSPDGRSASVTGRVQDANLDFPTTADRSGERLLVVEGQLDERSTGTPTLPFTVSGLPLTAFDA